jgi:hypothetical protein
LSDKPSRLIRQALLDLEIVERRPECIVNMYDHYMVLNDELEEPGICVMCLAGAVMYLGSREVRDAQEIGLSQEITASDFGDPAAPKLRFISEFQFGEFGSAFSELNLPLPEFLTDADFNFPKYSVDPALYKQTLLDYASKLEVVGL